MQPNRRTHLALMLSTATLVAALGVGVSLADYPERAITLVVPFAPGGANDVVARAIQQPLGEALGQPIIVENRGGGGGNVGTAYAARQKPDGYTILLSATNYAVNTSLYEKVGYDPLKDFEMIAEVTTFPVIYAVRADSGIKSIKDLIALAKSKPGGLNYSTPGAGTVPHLAVELLKLHTGAEMVHVPYAGAAPAAQALLTKTVEVAAISISVAKPQIESGAFVGLAVSGGERWPELPDVPTIAEAGVPSAIADTWQGLMTPTGTPKAAVDRLAKAAVAVVKRPDVRDRLLKVGFQATGRGSEDFRKRIVEEVPRWKAVIEKARITPQ